KPAPTAHVLNHGGWKRRHNIGPASANVVVMRCQSSAAVGRVCPFCVMLIWGYHMKLIVTLVPGGRTAMSMSAPRQVSLNESGRSGRPVTKANGTAPGNSIKVVP